MKTLKTLFILLLAITSSEIYAQPFVREWASFYGPESSELINLREDRQGNLYGSLDVLESPYDLTDYMNSFTTPGAFYTYDNEDFNSSNNSLFFKLNPQGEVVWSSFFPGHIMDMSLSPDGQFLYVVGGSIIDTDLIASEGAPFPDPYEFGDDPYHRLEGFVVKFDTNGQKIWGTYLPSVASLESDTAGNIYIAGITYLPDIFGTEGAFDPEFIGDGKNSYLLKMDAQGQIVWSTYYGLGGISEIAEDNGELYVGGSANQDSELNYYATDGAFLSGFTAGTYFSKFNIDGERLWSTYYGNAKPFDGIYSIKITQDQKVLITGTTSSTENIATSGTFRENMLGSSDYFLACFDPDGNREWGTYYGGTANELSNGILASGNGTDFFLYGGSKSKYGGISTPNGKYPEFSISPFGNHVDAMNGYIVKFSKENLGVSSIGNTNEIQLYPNPNDGRFTLIGTVLGKEEFQIQLFDFSGKLLISRNLGLYEEQHFDYSSYLKSGAYVVKLQSEHSGIQRTFKMIVK